MVITVLIVLIQYMATVEEIGDVRQTREKVSSLVQKRDARRNVVMCLLIWVLWDLSFGQRSAVIDVQVKWLQSLRPE